jgi:hypothetical protein
MNKTGSHGVCVRVYGEEFPHLDDYLDVMYHRKQGPIFVAHKFITQSSTYVKFAIKFEITANPVTNSKFVDDFVMNKNHNQIFKVYLDR